jgi:TRAP transporter TAXI family solute receptor
LRMPLGAAGGFLGVSLIRQAGRWKGFDHAAGERPGCWLIRRRRGARRPRMGPYPDAGCVSNEPETTKVKFFRTALLALCAAFGVAAFAQNISIATGGTGGVYYPMGGGLAAVLSKYVPGMQATAEVTGGSVDNLKLIGSGKPYVGFSMTDAAQDAFKGEDKFKGQKVPVRTLMVLYPNRMHVVSVDGKGVNKFSDLKGKRVSTGSPGSATEVMAFRLIEAAGMDKDKDLKRERLGVAESVNALKDGKIDAFFWVGGLPTAAVSDLANSPGNKLKMVDHAELVAAMNKKYGNLYVEDSIPKATYRGMDTDNKQATVQNILVAADTMDEKTAYNIVKTIFDRKADIVAVHKEAENFQLANQKKEASPVPWHPGAVKYFAEKGVKLN